MKYANFGALVTFLANAVLIPTLLLSQFIVILLCLDRFTVRQYKYLMNRIIFRADDIWNISAYRMFTLLLNCAFLFHGLLLDSFFFDL